MKIKTLVQKLFGASNCDDFIDTVEQDENNLLIEYFAIYENGDDCEPYYFVKLYANGMYIISDINSKVLLETDSESKVKSYIKSLAKKD